MARKLLIALLSIALLLEIALTAGAFFARDVTLQKFGVALNDGSSFLGYIIGWTLLYVTLMCCLILYRVITRRGDYATPGYILAAWWIGIGIGIYLGFKKPENLLTDSLKGALMLLLIYRARADERKNGNVTPD